MDHSEFIRHYLADSRKLLESLDSDRISEAITWLRRARSKGNTIFTCGNGGSSAIAAQMVADMVMGASVGKSHQFRMINLSDNVPTLTAYADSEGYESIFLEPFRNFARPGDLLLAISGSGDSPNVLAAVEYARQLGCPTIGLTSGSSGQLKDLVDLPLLVPSNHMGRLEDCFFTISHVLAYRFIEEEG